MDKATVKEQLKQYGLLKKELKQIEDRISTLRSTMYSIKSPTFDDIPGGSGNSDKIGNVVCTIMALEDKYLDTINDIIVKQQETEDMLKDLKGTEKLLMTAKYIDGNSWGDVYSIIGYSRRQTHRLHAYCLTKLAQMDL